MLHYPRKSNNGQWLNLNMPTGLPLMIHNQPVQASTIFPIHSSMVIDRCSFAAPNRRGDEDGESRSRNRSEGALQGALGVARALSKTTLGAVRIRVIQNSQN